jgi:diguanylate cyclase (GGDEF)-like protein/PAS domain S-box-containing protein
MEMKTRIFAGDALRSAVTALVVAVILGAIAASTYLSLKQTADQNDALRTLQAAGQFKHDLDELQQIMLDQHGDLYTVISTRAFYDRPKLKFPLAELLDLIADARARCGTDRQCDVRLSDLDAMIRQLAARSDALAARQYNHREVVALNDTELGEIDAWFYAVLTHVVELRVAADQHLGVAVTASSVEAAKVARWLMISAVTAAALVIMLISWNGRIARHLRHALRSASESRRMLRTVLDQIPHGIAWKDSQLRYLGGNGVYARDAGLSSGDALVGREDRQLRWKDDQAACAAADQQVLSSERSMVTSERRVTTASGREMWVRESRLPLRDEINAVVGVLIVYENITSQHDAQIALRVQSRAIDASSNGLLIVEHQSGRHVITHANPAFERITGHSLDDIVNAQWHKLYALIGQPEAWSEVDHAIVTDGEANVTLPLTRKDGRRSFVNVVVSPVRDQGGVTYHVGVLSDVTAIVDYQDQLERQARLDALTDLPNRNLLAQRLGAAIAAAALEQSNLAVVFVDLDRFKEVNDSLGHRAGDALLVAVAQRLQRTVRGTDLVSRYGGDEFVILVERCPAAHLLMLLDRLVRVMAEPFNVDGAELYVAASVGVSSYPDDGTDADTLISNADAAMYVAKTRGGSNYQFYRPELNQTVARRLHLSTRLRHAVRSSALSLEYQPQIDMRHGGIVGVEALLRWHDEELGDVSPATFVPVAEETGLIHEIGEWVLRTACRQALEWRNSGLAELTLSVNVSPVQLEHSDLAATVNEVLQETGWPAHLLELEVTEGALMRNVDDAARSLGQLRRRGVRIALDDFGTGYSSLSHLRNFTIDRLKIDRAFVREIGRDAQYEALTLAVINVANAMGFDLIAEGVELESQKQFLLDHGCHAAQGFLYSPAVRASRLTDSWFRADASV